MVKGGLGYIQGMNFVACVLVYHSSSIAKSSEIFNFIMLERSFQKIYEGDLSLSIQLAKSLLS